MQEQVSPLMIQLLDWLSGRSRTYAETMDAWRTSCPRLSIWEDALLGGLIQVERGEPGNEVQVMLTPQGRAILVANQRGSKA